MSILEVMLSTLLTKRTTGPLAACLRRHSTARGPNEDLIQVLSRYMEEEKASAFSNSFKVRAYSKAIDTIGQLHEQVRSVDQVKQLEGIGPRIADRIHAYLSGIPYEPPPSKTKPPKTLDNLRKEQVVSSLSTVRGIGPTKANALYDAGCMSLQDLKEPDFFKTLTRPQRIGAQYAICLGRHMTCEQASTIHDFVTQNVSSKYTVLLSGDFRRGLESAQNITLVVLHPQNTGIYPPEGPPNVDSTVKLKGRRGAIPAPFASHPETKVKSRGLPDSATFSTEILSPLECRGLLVATFAAGAQKWDGIVRVPERTGNDTEGNGWGTRAERIQGVQTCQGQFFGAEIYYVPHQCAGAASIALTGDFKFSVAVRKAASQHGFRLNEYGLWRWQGATTNASIDDFSSRESIKEHGGYWELVASEREEDILHAVGMGWVSPERRNFVNLDVQSKKQKRVEEPLLRN